MNDKIYIVKALEVGVSADDAFDYVVGYCESLEDAKAACAKLKAKNRDEIGRWEKYGCNCTVGCEAWPAADDKNAIAALENEKHKQCPFADLSIREVFYGKDDKSGGFEVSCKNKQDWCNKPYEYEYTIEEVEKI